MDTHLPPLPALEAPAIIQIQKNSATNDVRNSLDLNGLALLRKKAGGSEEERSQAIDEAGTQIESIFIQRALGSMREGSKHFKSGLWQSNAGDMYEGMHDQEIASTLSKTGIGISKPLVEQLRRQSGIVPPKPPKKPSPYPLKKPGGNPDVPSDLKVGKPNPTYSQNGVGDSASAQLDAENLRLYQNDDKLEKVLRGLKGKYSLSELTSTVEQEQEDTTHVETITIQEGLAGPDDPFVTNIKEKQTLEFYSPLNQVIQKVTFGIN